MTITYNHERFIGQAIESVLSQKTDFEIEFIINDDNSNDGTFNVIKKYVNEHPKGHLIKATRNHQNIGVHSNFFQALEKASGKYVALLDGDDYWTDIYKLQKQFDYLEIHPNHSLCAHNVQIVFEDKSKQKGLFIKNPDFFGATGAKEILRDIYIHTSSMFFRNKVKSFPDFAIKGKSLDVLLQYLLTRDGSSVYTFNDQMSVYRKHSNGITNRDKPEHIFLMENIIFQKKNYLPFVEKHHRSIVWQNTLDFYLQLIELFREDGDWKNFLKYNIKFLCHFWHLDGRHFKYWLAYCIFPTSYKKWKEKKS